MNTCRNMRPRIRLAMEVAFSTTDNFDSIHGADTSSSVRVDLGYFLMKNFRRDKSAVFTAERCVFAKNSFWEMEPNI